MRISHGEIGMTWFEFMQLTGEQVVELVQRSASQRPFESQPQGGKFGRYISVSTGKVIKAIPIHSN